MDEVQSFDHIHVNRQTNPWVNTRKKTAFAIKGHRHRVLVNIFPPTPACAVVDWRNFTPMWKPAYTLFSLIAVAVLCACISLLFPSDGVAVTEDYSLQFAGWMPDAEEDQPNLEFLQLIHR